MKKIRGFTLIELIIFIGIFTVAIAALVTTLVVIVGIQTRQVASNEVGTQSQFLLQQLQYYVQTARIVDMAQDSATGTLQLREAVASQDPTYITLATGTVYLQQGTGGSLQALTSNVVTVSQLTFTRHYNISSASAESGIDSVSFSFAMSATSTNGKQYSQTFRSSAAVPSPVPKIAMVQQAKTENNAASVSTIGASFATKNETGSLLIAVVANATLTSVTASDTAGNTWAWIASSSFSGARTQMVVFAAANAKNASDTVNANLGAGAGHAAIFVYEYRGAATSSSFDASSTNLNALTQAPTSGSANATSSVELLFGVNDNPSTSEVPSAGTGFTFEASSTAAYTTQIFIEGQNQYVTGPVSAGWQYTNTTPSTTALIATFE